MCLNLAKKMQVPATIGYQVPDMTVQNYNMPVQQPEIPAQQAAFYYPNTGKLVFLFKLLFQRLSENWLTLR